MAENRYELNKNLAQMLKGGVIMDVTSPEQAEIAEAAGACAVMALEKIPADIRAAGGDGKDGGAGAQGPNRLDQDPRQISPFQLPVYELTQDKRHQAGKAEGVPERANLPGEVALHIGALSVGSHHVVENDRHDRWPAEKKGAQNRAARHDADNDRQSVQAVDHLGDHHGRGLRRQLNIDLLRQVIGHSGLGFKEKSFIQL